MSKFIFFTILELDAAMAVDSVQDVLGKFASSTSGKMKSADVVALLEKTGQKPSRDSVQTLKGVLEDGFKMTAGTWTSSDVLELLTKAGYNFDQQPEAHTMSPTVSNVEASDIPASTAHTVKPGTMSPAVSNVEASGAPASNVQTVKPGLVIGQLRLLDHIPPIQVQYVKPYVINLLKMKGGQGVVANLVKVQTMANGRDLKLKFKNLSQETMETVVQASLVEVGALTVFTKAETQRQQSIDKAFAKKKGETRSAVGDVQATRSFLEMLGKLHGEGGSEKKRRRFSRRLNKSFVLSQRVATSGMLEAKEAASEASSSGEDE